ncbi:MAG: hypothetical protein KDB21_03130 [Acidimicrobiales bacterium]|nr:hypothetical protein [Acidimicrobiales bacterium]
MAPSQTSGKRGPAALTPEHKAALAEGRSQSRAVKHYLEALEATKPKRGRKRSPDAIKSRLEKLEDEIDAADPLKRLQLIQERMDLETELASEDDAVDLAELEAGFVAVAAGYGRRKGISYAAWRELGVSAAVLKQAGISRSA